MRSPVVATARTKKVDPLIAFYRLPPVPNEVLADQRTLSDEDFFGGLDLEYKPLRAVKAALKQRDLVTARAVVLKHFRTRSRPRMTQYRTDPHWSDWGEVTVRKRADALAENKHYNSDSTLVDVGGGPAEHGGIDWDKALKSTHEICRQGAMATLALAWSQATTAQDRRRYAETSERWLRGLVAARPFVLDAGFHRESFAEFSESHWQQLMTSYVMFHWGDVLDSPMFRTPGGLSDEFAWWFLKQYWFLAFQFTRLLGGSWRADNHHLMERGVTLYYLGVQFPEFQRARQLEEYARLTILRHFDHNVLPDNVGSEHCSAYNYRCLVRYAMPLSVARANGRTLLGKQREKRLQDWLEYHAWICAPDGRLADTGDGEASNLYRIAEQSGALLGNRVVKGVLESLGQAGPVNPAFQASWGKVKPLVPKQVSRIYPYAGHLAMRDGWRRDSMFLHMAIKNQSLYDIHTHWNTFEFTLAAHGKRLIGNPATRTYGLPKGVTRGFYFSMDAHNTLIIDDDTLKSHRALASKWGLQPPRIQSACSCLNAAGRYDYASFTHHGYLPLIHRRDVLFVRGRYVIMTDGITMDFREVNAVFGSEGDIRPHTYRQRIHFETGVCARAGQQGGSVVAGDASSGAGVLIVPEPFENLRTVVGANEYMQELNHPDFAGYQMADIFRGTIGASFFSTVYYPFSGEVSVVTVTSLTPKTMPYRDDWCHAVRIEDGEFTDVWFVQRDRARPKRYQIDRDGISLTTDAVCLLVSMKDGQVVDSFQCGGRESVLNGEKVRVRPLNLVRHV